MRAATGTSILNGIAIGPLRVYKKTEPVPALISHLTPGEEWERFEAACAKTREQLAELHEMALRAAGRSSAAIFEIHRMMLEDEDYRDAVKNILETQGASAEYAVFTAGEDFSAVFDAVENEYIRARAVDVKDVSRRVVRILTCRDELDLPDRQPAVLMADGFTPGELVRFDRSKVLGLITRQGSPNSHAAILARTLNIPALTGVDFDESWDGHPAVLDGYGGCVYIDPLPELTVAMEEKRGEDLKRESLLLGLRKKPNITLDGREIKIYANINRAGDVELALRNDAQGIGLFRSEYLFLDAEEEPSEDQQFLLYKRVVETMAGKRTVIRTMDAGADKTAACMNLDREENPALGYRGIRVSLTREESFRRQLRAILRAGAFGTVSILFPMITSVWEVRDAREILEACKTELRERGIAVGEVEVGIMIETPAAVMTADELAEEVDFFSIGTNDLTQYTLAVDRQNPKLDSFYDPCHPAVLRMIQAAVDAGHRHNCRVGICGELAANPAMTETLLRMGLDELSVPPAAVLPLRKLVRSLDLGRELET